MDLNYFFITFHLLLFNTCSRTEPFAVKIQPLALGMENLSLPSRPLAYSRAPCNQLQLSSVAEGRFVKLFRSLRRDNLNYRSKNQLFLLHDAHTFSIIILIKSYSVSHAELIALVISALHVLDIEILPLVLHLSQGLEVGCCIKSIFWFSGSNTIKSC